jgi:hypothetical protein
MFRLHTKDAIMSNIKSFYSDSMATILIVFFRVQVEICFILARSYLYLYFIYFPCIIYGYKYHRFGKSPITILVIKKII